MKEAFEPTSEQNEIIKVAKEGKDIVIKAFAGSGKTSTLCLVADRLIKAHKKVIYLAFNKAIADEAKHKFPKEVIVKTTHALAYASVSKVMNLKEVRGDYKVAEIRSIIPELCEFNYLFVKAISNVFVAFCNSDAIEIDGHFVETVIKETPELAILLRNSSNTSKIARYAKMFWDMMESQVIAPTHSFYVKYYQISGLASNDRYDVILLDEAQDTNAVTFDIVKQLKGQKIIVGDEHQKIYGFRGSLNIMNMLPNAEVKCLSKSFRFGSNIAKTANELLNRFKGETVSIEGIQSTPLKLNTKITTAHITRTNSHIVRLIVEFTKNNDTSSWTTVRNPNEIFTPALSIIKYFIEPSIDFVIPASFQWLSQFYDIDEFKEYVELVDDIELKTALKIAEEYEAKLLKYLLIAQKRYNSSDAVNYLTTAHTAKGLEWDYVVLHQDFGSLLEKIAESFTSIKAYKKAVNSSAKAKIDEEINLIYVAITRARYSVVANFQDSEMILNSFGVYSIEDIDREINKKHKMYRILKRGTNMKKLFAR